MRPKLPVVVLTLIIVATWVGTAGAGAPLPYNLDKAERGFFEPDTVRPSQPAALADAAIGRPVGLVMTTLGATLFTLTLPFTAPSGNAREAAWYLIGQPGGWTFCRPLGRSDPRYEPERVFK
jgi:hypothetical protein